MEREKILIVNGDENVRNALEESLKKDYEVFSSVAFDKALEVFKEKLFNVVITEINTPDVKGIEVLRKFQTIKSDVPIIVVTTFDSVPLAVEAMKVGAYDYITKPFNTDELKLIVEHALERQKLLEEVKEKKLYQELAVLDGLTQVYNRRYFEELLRREIDRALRYPQKFSLLMIDIDDFKKINDTYGHPAGDKILKGIADLIACRIRSTDFVARYGGEEFSVISPHTDKRGASVLAARLVDLVNRAEFIVEDSKMVKAYISIGVATFREDATTRSELIQRADKALYQAKSLGKNRVCLFGFGV